MDLEEISALGFMIFGMGFFIAVCIFAVRVEDKDYNRKLTEAREFGFAGSRLERVVNDPKKRK